MSRGRKWPEGQVCQGEKHGNKTVKVPALRGLYSPVGISRIRTECDVC